MVTVISMDRLALLRLLHLVSPSLPTGAFSYSQGLEWAVDAGWVHDGQSLEKWLDDLLFGSMALTDIPILAQMIRACREAREDQLDRWCSTLLAFRETSELRMEECNRGRAMAVLLQGLGIPYSSQWQKTISRSQLAGFALATVAWDISVDRSCLGYIWAWLENQVLAGVKIVPLGQTEGQQIIFRLTGKVQQAVELGLKLEKNDIGGSSQALSLASSLHEIQYTRLYRS
jgi:urease accessory protein